MNLSTLRRLATLLVGAMLAVSLGEAGHASTPAPAFTATNDAEAFPVTVVNAYGDITLGARPVRIVALSTQYADMLAAIGVEPIAYTQGAQFSGDVPWLTGLATGPADVQLLTVDGTVSAEAIAAYEPDLILGNTWHMDEAVHAELSRVAPTYVGNIVGNPDWIDTLTAVGELTGEREAAADAIAAVDGLYAEARTRLPGLQGATYNYVGFFGTDFNFGNGSWLEGFGLVPAENQRNEQTGTETVSFENMDQLAADVLAVFIPGGDFSPIQDDLRYDDLPAARNGTAIFLDTQQALAVTAPGPHSLAWAIELVSPALEESALNTGES